MLMRAEEELYAHLILFIFYLKGQYEAKCMTEEVSGTPGGMYTYI